MSQGIVIYGLAAVAGFGAALVAGVMFAFSTFVMDGLDRVGPESGMRAMQGINEAAITPAFILLLLGTGVISVVLALTIHFSHHATPKSGWMLVGAAIYVLGVVVVTAVGNVPMNNALAGLSASELGGQAYWATYLGRWTLLNHVRTLTSASAAVAFLVAIYN